MSNIVLGFLLFMFGGSCYYGLEILWDGSSHYAMFIVGGVCFFLVGIQNELFKWSKVVQIIVGTIVVTVIEYIAGYILNIRMGLKIWDYSNLPLNINGQVCLWFSLLWSFLISWVIELDDGIRKLYWKLVEEIKRRLGK